ncbi:MAG: hypothetical protein AAF573_03015 [Bacteroidota bacterium]
MRGIGVPSTRDQRRRKEKEQVEKVTLLLYHSLAHLPDKPTQQFLTQWYYLHETVPHHPWSLCCRRRR